MNNSPIYEQLIAQKLHQLPVPDMADAIWANIKTQLDNDMPTDDNNNPPPPSTPNSPRRYLKRGIPWITAIIAFVAIIVINRQHKQDKKFSTPIIPATKEQTSLPAKTNKPDNPNDKSNKTFNQAGNAVPNIIVDSGQITPPQTAFPPIVVNNGVDSSLNHVANPKQLPLVANPPVLKNDTTPVRKKRGVQGITDNDYKIVTPPKKTN